ncbi:hypothetical protein P43SY_005954 [Pythium insidiosum]|uniref:Uncharacterized protein n=1 Tax=Pythium insidiosum TaxID=114742 RepID=A0AAD5LE90_PYTIN|nr:hypothetical protein P43SY_005954 [Pythium insidiosum]
MADPVTADSVTAALSAANDKKRALEEDAAELGEDDELELDETTLDDVMVSPVLKKARVDEEASGDPDEGVDDEEDDEEDLAPPEEQNGGGENAFVGEENEDEEEEDEDDDDIAPPRSDNDIDIVTVDDDEEEMEEFEEEEERDEEEEDEDDDDTDDEHAAARSTASPSAASLISPLQRRKMEQNRLEARRLIQQLDNSARSKLVLTALEKYGEELFEGHETARDAILVDACAHDSMLGLMKEAIRLSELYLRGTVEAPLEVDEDEEDEDEDEDEEAFTEGSMRQHASADEDDEATNSEINLLSEEDETDEFAGSRPQDEENEVDEEGDNDDDDGEDDDDGLAHSDAGDAYAMTAQGDEEEYVDVDEDEGEDEDAVATEQGERGVPTG